MKKLLALSACVALLAGCDFVGNSDVTPVAFSGLTITSAPLPADEDGSAPDLYVEIQDAGGRTVFRAADVEEDFAGTFPYEVPGMSGELPGTSRSYFVVILDQDVDDYDLVAVTDAFSADEIRASTASTFEVSNEEGTVYAEFAITR